MVLDTSPDLDRVFHALAHPARRQMVRRLASGEQNLSALAAPLKMSFPAASKHVRVLEGARLVRRRVAGREHICRLHAGPLREIAEWTEQFRQQWEARFDVLDALLEEMKAVEGIGVTSPEAARPTRSAQIKQAAKRKTSKSTPSARGRSRRPRRET